MGAYELNTPLPRLQVVGNHLEKPDGTPITLKGVSLCSLSWHKPLDLIQTVTDSKEGWNVNVIRLPVQPKEWNQLGAKTYIEERLDPAVKLCKENNVYCIIDWHAIADWNTPETEEALKGFWQNVAPRYAEDSHILYEIFNEPKAPSSITRSNWKAWKATAQEWVNALRIDAPETIILIGSPYWSKIPFFAVKDPFEGPQLVYVMHLYPTLFAPLWKALLAKASREIPLFITEWGWSSQKLNAETPFYGTQKSFAEPLQVYLEKRPHINWTAWSYDPKCGPAMTGQDSEMGRFVKDWLKSNTLTQ